MILTRFSRVTFNAAHNYLGLTTEVLRTEKAINDIACHPLPQSFYQGGLKQLRHRFDGVSISSDSDTKSDYFSYVSSSHSPSDSFILKDDLKKSQKNASSTATVGNESSRVTPHNSHHFVQAGDLFTTTVNYTESQSPNPIARTMSGSGTVGAPTPRLERLELLSDNMQRLSGDEFDLREEVMSCIAKSIGLIQPPISGGDSVEASPAFPPSDGGVSRGGAFRSSFGSLSLLDIGVDDASSSRTDSSSSVTDVYLSNLDNEVEILFFPAGSVLAKAGDRNTGA